MHFDKRKGAGGFTLVEVVSAGFVLGVFVFFALPVMQEMRLHHVSQIFQLEVGEAMQRKMEEIQQMPLEECRGQQKVKSKKTKRKEFLLRWNCKQVEPFLYQLELEAKWVGFDGKSKRKRWVTHRFHP